jgi:hypothetical protein
MDPGTGAGSMPTEIVTRAEAIAKGLPYFWSETPCRRAGHVGFRRVTAYDCYECSKQNNRDWHKDNPDLAREKYERFLEENPTYYVDYNRAHPEECKAANKRWRKRNPDKHAAEVRRYILRHQDRIYAERRRKNKERRKTDPVFCVRQNMAARLSMAIRAALGKKSASTMELVGCEIEELMAHLERQFLPGMTWSNYGKKKDCWSIDHIRPCASYDLRNPKEQRACFHFSNLQPLWHSLNLAKKDRYQHPQEKGNGEAPQL